ncbi:phosphotransferase [Spirillospora sp. CA-108201]
MSAPFPVLAAMLRARDFPPAIRREPIHVWAMSSVERVHLKDGQTVILKSASPLFAKEAATLKHVAPYVPVPQMLGARTLPDGRLAMLLQDLGEHPEEDPPLEVGARVAVGVHACPPKGALPRLSRARLAALPKDALASLTTLHRFGRWSDTDDIRESLEALVKVARRRSRDAAVPPFGMCHSEFHPTSIHRGPRGLYVLDWARAFTGPGLLDLASWEDTPKPLNTDALANLIVRYVEAGGPLEAMKKRDGLAPQIWAGGWHRVWISEWYLQQCVYWIPDPANDPAVQKVVRRHLSEATECLC